MTLIDPRELVAEALGCDVASLNDESRLADHPKWDSFGHLNVMMSLEKFYGVTIDDDSIRKYESLRNIVDLHKALAADRSRVG